MLQVGATRWGLIIVAVRRLRNLGIVSEVFAIRDKEAAAFIRRGRIPTHLCRPTCGRGQRWWDPQPARFEFGGHCRIWNCEPSIEDSLLCGGIVMLFGVGGDRSYVDLRFGPPYRKSYFSHRSHISLEDSDLGVRPSTWHSVEELLSRLLDKSMS